MSSSERPYPPGYQPTDWVKSVVGQRYRGMDCYTQGWPTRIWLCTGYDPACGFWMQTNDDMGPPRETCISERAVDRTWHRVRGPDES